MNEKSYIGIPLNKYQEKQILDIQNWLPHDFNLAKKPFHLTLDYLWKKNTPIYWERILNQCKKKCGEILDKEVQFSRTLFMRNRYGDDWIYLLWCDEISKKILNQVYDAMNIPELNSQYSSKVWTPHITIATVNNYNFTKENFETKIKSPILLKLSEMKIL